MLFKILHGDKTRISTDITPYHEGYCYVTHNGDFYVDMNNERVKLNAKDAETIMGVSLNDAINNALTQAKASGEFDGEDGEDGYVPVRGTDYWTDADKAEIKSYVDDAILNGVW
jgi:hypothetical protein